MPRPTPEGGPRQPVRTRLLAKEIKRLDEIAMLNGLYDSETGRVNRSDAVRFLLAQADDQFTAPEKGPSA